MAYVIPTIYTAVDRMSGVQGAIARSAAAMNSQLNALTPTFSNATQQMWDYAKSAVGVTAAFAAIALSGKSLLDYEDAVASFRVIVDDLNDVQFSKFKAEITDVAYATRKSTVDVAQSFEKIAALNPKFAETATGIGLVSEAVITLAKAAKMELGVAAENTTNIMNQFSLGVEQANRTVNALAAGQAVGAASIQQISAALTEFGAVAAGANISLEQSVALIETIAKYGQMGEQAGNRLRASIGKLQEAHIGYGSGVFNINNALADLKKGYDGLSTEMQKNDYLSNIFGERQILIGRLLLTNIPLFNEYTQGLTGTSEAQKQAEIQSNTLSNRLTELKNKWVTLITTSENVGIAFDAVKSSVVFITDHMAGLVSVAATAIGAWSAMKLGIFAVTKAIWLWDIAANTAILVMDGLSTAAFFATADIVGLGMSFAAILPQLALVGLAVGVLGSIYQHNTNHTKTYGLALDEINGKLTIQNKSLTDAQVGLQKYQEAFAAAEKYKENVVVANYEKAHGIRNLGNLYGLYQPSMSAPEAQAPNPEYYLGKGNYTESKDAQGNTVVQLNVTNNVDKNGNVTTNVTGGGNISIMPQTTTTSK